MREALVVSFIKALNSILHWVILKKPWSQQYVSSAAAVGASLTSIIAPILAKRASFAGGKAAVR